MAETQLCQGGSFGVREKKLLRVIGQNANAIDALVDHAVEHAPLTVFVQ